MRTDILFPISYSKTHLGELIRRAQGGESIVVTNNGTPAVALVRFADYVSLQESQARELVKKETP